jgi:phosphate transport system substrate-binding protein
MMDFQQSVMDGAPYRADRKELDRQVQQAELLLKEPNGITMLSSVYGRPECKPITIDGVAPEPQHVRSGAYILSRPLILVSPARPTAEVRAFVAYFLSLEGQAIVAGKFTSIR